MRYRRLDADGDYTFGTGQDFLVNSPDAVGQAVLTRLRLWFGEWFVDQRDGTPYNEEILGKRYPRKNPDAAIKRRILGTPNVTEIVAYSSQFDGETRKYSIAATINTAFGAVKISETL